MPVPCARCRMPLMKWDLQSGDTTECPACGSSNHVRLFPAAMAHSAAPSAEPAVEGEAACFDHPGKRAFAACDRCGRFVCRLCAVDVEAGVSCPSCFAKPQAAKRKGNPDQERTLYDTLALTIPLALTVLWPLSIVSAPAVGALAIMKWKQPISLVRRNRWRFVVGLVLALAQGGLWVWWIWYWMARFGSRV